MDFEIDTKNVEKFAPDKGDSQFLNKNFDLDKDVIKKSKNRKKIVSKEEFTKLLQKMKLEREIVEQRIQELKEYM